MLAILAWAVSAAEIGLYFGSGCFWHVQHGLIEAERQILGRSDADLTAIAGYAGGSTSAGGGSRVCYHTDPSNDYSVAGHTEVVYVSVPRAQVQDFAAAFWQLFTGNGGTDRQDVQDVGAQYRAAIGVPGLDSTVVAQINASQGTHIFELRTGSGSDADTLAQSLVWVYDATSKPFFQAELSHQFHNDMAATYTAEYSALKQAFIGSGKLQATGCAGDGDGSGTQKTYPTSFTSAANAAQTAIPSLSQTASHTRLATAARVLTAPESPLVAQTLAGSASHRHLNRIFDPTAGSAFRVDAQVEQMPRFSVKIGDH